MLVSVLVSVLVCMGVRVGRRAGEGREVVQAGKRKQELLLINDRLHKYYLT